MVEGYLKHLRPKYVGAKTHDDQPLFLSAMGEQITHSLFTKALKRQTGSEISLTKNRKIVVTRKKKEGASEQEMAELAQHMTHSSRTQNMYYECSNRIEQSVETYEDLAAATKSSGTSSEDLAARSSVTSELVDPSDEEASNNVLPGPISVPTLQASACSGDSISSAPSVVFTSSLAKKWKPTTSVCSQASTHGRRADYTEEQSQTIRKLFRENIFSQRVQLSEIRQTLAAYPDEAAKIEEFKVEQIKDKIRTYYMK